MDQSNSAGGCLPACSLPCFLLEEGEEEERPFPLEGMRLDSLTEDASAFEGRGRRLTTADLIGEQPVLGVRRRLYELQRISRSYSGLLPQRLVEGWWQRTPEMVFLVPVQPDAVLSGEAALRSPAELLAFPSPTAPALAALALLQSLLSLHKEQQTQESRQRPSGSALSECESEDSSPSECSSLDSAEAFAAGQHADDGGQTGSEQQLQQQQLQRLQQEGQEEASFSNVERHRPDFPSNTGVENERQEAEAPAAAEGGLRVEKQEIVSALKALAFQRRLLQSSGYELPQCLRRHPVSLLLDDNAAGGGGEEGSSSRRLNLHLLNFCTHVVNALALHRWQSGEEALETVYSVSQQYSHLIGCIHALSAAFRTLAEFRAERDSLLFLEDQQEASAAAESEEEEAEEEGEKEEEEGGRPAGESADGDSQEAGTSAEATSGEAVEGGEGGKKKKTRKRQVAQKKKGKIQKQSKRVSGKGAADADGLADLTEKKPLNASQQKRAAEGKSVKRKKPARKTEEGSASSKAKSQKITRGGGPRKKSKTPAAARLAPHSQVSGRLMKNLLDEGMSPTEGCTEFVGGEVVPVEPTKVNATPPAAGCCSLSSQEEEEALLLAAKQAADDTGGVIRSESSLPEEEGEEKALVDSIKADTCGPTVLCVADIREEQDASVCPSAKQPEKEAEEEALETGEAGSSKLPVGGEQEASWCPSSPSSAAASSGASGIDLGDLASCGSLAADGLQPAFSAEVSRHVQQLLAAAPSSLDSFDCDNPLLSLRSKVYRRQVRSVVGEFMRGETSLTSFKRSSLAVAPRSWSFPTDREADCVVLLGAPKSSFPFHSADSHGRRQIRHLSAIAEFLYFCKIRMLHAAAALK
ncbi:hypothetical protein Efla_005534 [Eimeria flavescens]